VNPAALNILQQPFVQVALPIIVAITVSAWRQNKRFDDLSSRFDDMNRRLDEMVRLRDRCSPNIVPIRTEYQK
jgi:hypothetical protein